MGLTAGASLAAGEAAQGIFHFSAHTESQVSWSSGACKKTAKPRSSLVKTEQMVRQAIWNIPSSPKKSQQCLLLALDPGFESAQVILEGDDVIPTEHH